VIDHLKPSATPSQVAGQRRSLGKTKSSIVEWDTIDPRAHRIARRSFNLSGLATFLKMIFCFVVQVLAPGRGVAGAMLGAGVPGAGSPANGQLQVVGQLQLLGQQWQLGTLAACSWWDTCSFWGRCHWH